MSAVVGDTAPNDELFKTSLWWLQRVAGLLRPEVCSFALNFYSFIMFAHYFFLNSHRTNSLLTLFHELFRPSNNHSTPRSSVWPFCQVDRLRWRPLVLYQTSKTLFVAKSLHKQFRTTIFIIFPSFSPFLHNFYYTFFLRCSYDLFLLSYICWFIV